MFIMSNMMMFINEIVSQMFRVPAKPCSGDGSPGRPVTVALGEATAGGGGGGGLQTRKPQSVLRGSRCSLRRPQNRRLLGASTCTPARAGTHRELAAVWTSRRPREQGRQESRGSGCHPRAARGIQWVWDAVHRVAAVVSCAHGARPERQS